VPYLPYVAVAVLAAWSLRGLDRHPSRARWLVLWALATAAGFVVTAVVSTGRGTPFGDFDKAYYAAGQAVWSVPGGLYACGNADGLCFVNLPIVALAFAPLGALPRDTAHVVMTLVAAASVVAAIVLLVRLADARGTRRLAIVTLVLMNGPLMYSLRLANLTHVVLVLLAASLLALQRGRPAVAGALLAVCAVIKPPFLLWLPYLAARRGTRSGAAVFCLLIVAAVAVSLAWFGSDLNAAWLAQFIGGPSTRPIGAYNAQSISGALIRLTTSAHLVDWVGVTMPPWLRATSLALTAIVMAIAAAAVAFSAPPADAGDRLAEQSLVIATMLLVSPVSWTHYYCYLLVPMAAWAGGRFAKAPPMVARSCLAGFALVSLPVTLWIPGHAVAGPVVARLLLSHYAAGAALLVGALAAWRLRLSPTLMAELAGAPRATV
jgi:hypothetical protein